MNCSVLQLILVVLSIGSGAVLMAPSRGEQLSMMVHDGRFAEAAAEILRDLRNGNVKSDLLALLALAHEGNGDAREAAFTMEQFLTMRPQDTEALKLLISLYADADMPEEMLRSMERLETLAPTAERSSRLLALFRLYGKVEAEKKLLLRLQERRLLSPENCRRLGEVLVQRGDSPGAIKALSDALEQEGAAGAKTLMLLFELLATAGQFAAATDRVAAWVSVHHDAMVPIKVVARLEALGEMGHAHSLLSVLVELNSGSRFFLARQLTEHNANGSALFLLASWLQEAKSPTLGEIGQFVSVARMTGFEPLLWRAFALIISKPQWLDAQAYMAQYVFDEFGAAGLAPFRAFLTPKALRQRPLFAAKLAIQENEVLVARAYLEDANVRALSVEEQRYWLDLLIALCGENDAVQILADKWRSKELPRELLAGFAVLAARLGLVAEYEKAFVEVSHF